MATNTRDPRSIITPDAFSVSEALLGLPLARPGLRFWSMIVDLLVIGFISVITSDFSLIIWGAVGLFFLQMALRNPGTKFGNVTGWLFRGATGCLGVLILTGVGIGWLAMSVSEDDLVRDYARGAVEDAVTDARGIQVPAVPGVEGVDVGERGGGVGAFLGALGGAGRIAGIGAELSEADDSEEAADLLYAALDVAYDALAMRGPQLDEYLEALVTDDAAYTDDPDAFRVEVLEGWAAARGVDLSAGGESRDADPGEDSVVAAGTGESESEGAPDGSEVDPIEVAEAVGALSASQVLNEWADRIESGDTLPSDYRAVAIRTRATEILAADTLAALDRTTAELRDELGSTRDDLIEAEADLEEAQGGITALLRDIWDQLGSAFGLWTIYFTVMLTLFKGRTIGKMVTRTRVVRLDGEPITWWAAFERCGGYFAGIATGLLGFAQVYWDPNRQCVHDKIVGTAVVLDGQAAVPGAWQQAAGYGATE